MADEIDRPIACEVAQFYGSDAIAEMMRRLDIPYVALNPGSSFRGLHDSLVNHLGNRSPQMLLCLHEEHAVAIAHGYAKVTERPLGVILHANVGLMHAAMALYNAWCDRVPMLVFGATGPVDAAKRRPWIDWLHTSRDQASIVRPYVKWDDQPASLAASLQSMMRARLLTSTAPMAPTYVCFDVSVQEQSLDEMPAFPDPDRNALPQFARPGEAEASQVLTFVEAAEAPVFLMGRVSRDRAAWDRRVALAEHFGAKVVTDIKQAAAFPTRHPLHAGAPSFFLSDASVKTLAGADLVVCFDWVDPAGALSQAGIDRDRTKVVNVTLGPLLQNGWSLDHGSLLQADLSLLCAPDALIAALCDLAGIGEGKASDWAVRLEPERRQAAKGPTITVNALADELARQLDGVERTHIRFTLGWDGGRCDFRVPLDYLGYDGGAGIGSGPGMAVGAALALRDTGRLPVAVLGDGDFLMGATALWTAAHHKLPLLIVVANNRSYFNDEVHQEHVARHRNRPVENKHVGQAIEEPDIDIAAIARAQGATGYGPVEQPGELAGVLAQAIQDTRAGHTVVVDVRVKRGYSEDMAEGMTQE
ncbi:thiamine pyrophosphate-binding protein [Jiella avicenniae]|uniref:Thiamine pyrophosphate-dependent enzyme n=1 Tax=Jiella avicenniae TaxID=2907202 RepID=A0A9X1P2N6_9HYPH|nr:thiamine pyrophosphate-binding protein [Jiella avicenniae]MCE7029957.1 thiamine pyrophosphate-dependent enzyme [Jiella avicenniae]